MTSVGLRALEVVDAEHALRISAWLLYPADAAPSVQRFGPYELDVAPGASAAGTDHPLVVYSHGNGATPWVARGLLLHLVRSGFVVATLEHPGNNRSDNSLSDAAGLAKRLNLEYRPRHLQLVIDAAFGDADVGPRLRVSCVAVAGHSIGGYTALALAGGHAMTFPDDVEQARRLAPDPDTLRLLAPVATPHDARVRAVVLLAPALAWFSAENALADVAARLFVRVGEQDAMCSPAQVTHALRSLPIRRDTAERGAHGPAAVSSHGAQLPIHDDARESHGPDAASSQGAPPPIHDDARGSHGPGAVSSHGSDPASSHGARLPIGDDARGSHGARPPLRAAADVASVPGAGHFSFLSPFPPELAHLPPARDPPGFDRAAYQQVLAADVTAFLREALA